MRLHSFQLIPESTNSKCGVWIGNFPCESKCLVSCPQCWKSFSLLPADLDMTRYKAADSVLCNRQCQFSQVQVMVVQCTPKSGDFFNAMAVCDVSENGSLMRMDNTGAAMKIFIPRTHEERFCAFSLIHVKALDFRVCLQKSTCANTCDAAPCAFMVS